MNRAFAAVRMDERHPHWQQAIAREKRLYHRRGDFRTEFGRDYTRIIHSTAYSRLKHKTQVFFTTKNDHICTRIEHVNQVASVSQTIGRYLGLNTELIAAIATGHDLGHAPFGHLGERVLRAICKEDLGTSFWHERQGLRVVDGIETLLDPAGRTVNMLLTYAVRDGIINHCGEVREAVLRPREEAIPLQSITHPGQYEPYTWEGCVVEISDKIAYLGRDIEDAVRLKIIDENGTPARALKERLQNKFHIVLPSLTNTSIMYPLITDLCSESTPEKGLLLSKKNIHLMNDVMNFNYRYIYRHKRLQIYHEYAKLIIQSIYYTLRDCYAGEKTLQRIREMSEYYPTLGTHFLERLQKFSDIGRAETKQDRFGNVFKNTVLYAIGTEEKAYKAACVDYIAGMTDRYAEKIFTELTTF